MEEHIGKTYNYKGTNIEIQKIKNVSGNIVVVTDKRTFNLLPSELSDFTSELKPKKTIDIISTIKKDETILDIKSVLFEAIEKVKNDPTYVRQANAICNITSQLINIKKLDLNQKK